jgi:hypothetical protein
MIVDLRLDKQFAHVAQRHGAGRVAEIGDLMECVFGLHSCGFLIARGLEK